MSRLSLKSRVEVRPLLVAGSGDRKDEIVRVLPAVERERAAVRIAKGYGKTKMKPDLVMLAPMYLCFKVYDIMLLAHVSEIIALRY